MSDEVTTQKVVLIVEDEKIVAIMAEAMLKTLGYASVVCADGSSAVATFKDRCDDIEFVLLDVLLPDMDGIEIYGELKALDPEVKCIVSSGLALDDSIEALLAQGANAFIQKPFKVAQLKSAIDGF